MSKKIRPLLIQDHIFTFYFLVPAVVLQSNHAYTFKLHPNVDSLLALEDVY